MKELMYLKHRACSRNFHDCLCSFPTAANPRGLNEQKEGLFSHSPEAGT